jgi:hypothetical protein
MSSTTNNVKIRGYDMYLMIAGGNPYAPTKSIGTITGLPSGTIPEKYTINPNNFNIKVNNEDISKQYEAFYTDHFVSQNNIGIHPGAKQMIVFSVYAGQGGQGKQGTTSFVEPFVNFDRFLYEQENKSNFFMNKKIIEPFSVGSLFDNGGSIGGIIDVLNPIKPITGSVGEVGGGGGGGGGGDGGGGGNNSTKVIQQYKGGANGKDGTRGKIIKFGPIDISSRTYSVVIGDGSQGSNATSDVNKGISTSANVITEMPLIPNEGGISYIRYNNTTISVYTTTGEIIDPKNAPVLFSSYGLGGKGGTNPGEAGTAGTKGMCRVYFLW